MPEEINLMDYLKVILKRKKLILGFLLPGLIIGGALTFFLPESHRAKSIVEIGESSGVLLEDSAEMINKIEYDLYGNFSDAEVNVKAENLKGKNLIKIEVVSTNLENANRVLEKINESILASHANKIDSQINEVNSRREVLEKNLEELQKDISYLLLRGQQIAGLQLKVYDLQMEIFDLQEQIEYFQLTKIFQEPAISKKPDLILNLIFGGTLGIFVGICLAFIQEWWKKNKYQLGE